MPRPRLLSDDDTDTIEDEDEPVSNRPRLDRLRPRQGGIGNGFIATEEQRRFVSVLIASGMKHEEIAPLIKYPNSTDSISLRVFARAFAYEIANGRIEANGKVALSLHQLATGRDAVLNEDGKIVIPPKRPDMAAIRWWEVTRSGHKEVTRQEQTGADGAALGSRIVIMLPTNGRETVRDVTPAKVALPARVSE